MILGNLKVCHRNGMSCTKTVLCMINAAYCGLEPSSSIESILPLSKEVDV